MFTKRFSLETAYYSGGRVVLNHLMFFLFAMGLGILAGGILLAVLGVVDILALHKHIIPLMNMFQNAFFTATGSLHHAGFTMADVLDGYVPAEVTHQALGDGVISFDLSGYDFGYILSWILPTALVYKLFLDMLSVGWTKVALDLNANRQVSYRYLYQYYYLVPRVFLVNLFVGIALILGCMLFILPGVFLYQRLRFSKYFIIDKNLGMVKAVQASWALTEGAVLQLCGFSIISTILDSIGNAILLLRLFVMPLQNQVDANVYIQLSSR